MIETKTYCPVCNDGYSDEDFMFGYCCGEKLRERLLTREEKEARMLALKSIKAKVAKLGW